MKKKFKKKGGVKMAGDSVLWDHEHPMVEKLLKKVSMLHLTSDKQDMMNEIQGRLLSNPDGKLSPRDIAELDRMIKIGSYKDGGEK